MKSFYLLVVLLTITMISSAQNIQKQKFHWGRQQDTTAGYAQALKIDNVLYISGTVARDVNEEGIRNVYTSLERTLKHYGATFQNVVKETLYTTDMEAMKKFNYVRKPFYKGDFPAATWVQITRLFMPDARLEVELVAHLPQVKNK